MHSVAASVLADRPDGAANAGATGAAPSTRDFAELGLGNGAPLELRRLGLDESRYPTELIGYVRGVSVIVKMPVQEDRLVLLRDGQPVVIRAFTGTEALSFKTEVVAARFAPTPYLHLDYPKSINTTLVRRTERVNVNLIATASGHDAHVNLVVLDLSATGAKVSAPHSLGKFGAHVKLAVALKAPTGIAALVIECLICSERHDAQTRNVIHGLKFQDVEPICALAIRGFLATARGREGKSVTQRHAGHAAAK